MTSPLSSIRNLDSLMKKVVLKLRSLRRKNSVSLARMKRIAARYKLAPNLPLLGTTSWSWPFKVGHGTIVKAIKRKNANIFGQLKTDAFNEGQNAFEKMMNQIGVRAKGS